MAEFILRLVISLALCYLIGSVNFAVLISRLFSDDIRTHGSGNAGMTNMMRVHGFFPGLITFLGDAAKGIASMLICKSFILIPAPGGADSMILQVFSPEYMLYICGFACLIGHAYPLFFGFRGGKGVATTLGIFIVIDPVVAAFGLAFFIISLLFFGIISVSSVMAGVEMIFTALLKSIYLGLPIGFTVLNTVLTAVIIGFALYKHKENIIRIRRGEEKPLKVKR